MGPASIVFHTSMADVASGIVWAIVQPTVAIALAWRMGWRGLLLAAPWSIFAALTLLVKDAVTYAEPVDEFTKLATALQGAGTPALLLSLILLVVVGVRGKGPGGAVDD